MRSFPELEEQARLTRGSAQRMIKHMMCRAKQRMKRPGQTSQSADEELAGTRARASVVTRRPNPILTSMAKSPAKRTPNHLLLSQVISTITPEKAPALRRALIQELRSSHARIRAFELADTFVLPGEQRPVHDYFIYDTPEAQEWLRHAEELVRPSSRSRYYRPSLRDIHNGVADLSLAEHDTRTYINNLRRSRDTHGRQSGTETTGAAIGDDVAGTGLTEGDPTGAAQQEFEAALERDKALV